ncbi:hypothetical protein BAE44_0026221 [Dichanthelium oligosanthes]|uniref:Gnk2-homologous domain-containing protein n=1 Tax=Dichanthelium oligosanthes TaxID=888268 RepID=A0A1E5UIS1_9POAL|nr:hypothetical protein BAE44_0026221 [Dichanthelium oligosanthes]
MAFPKRRALSTLILLVLLTDGHAIAIKLDASTTFGHFPALVHCAPTPSKNDSAFRASVLSALGALPSAAAAAPTGFAATRSGSAFARGLCFGLGERHGSSSGDCHACLSAAAQDVVAGGCGASRRAGAWRAGCFLSYADTNASSAQEDAFHGWFYDSGGPTAALGSQCAGDLTAADCSRCTNESARVVPPAHLAMVHGNAVVVVGYGCYLRISIDALWPWWLRTGELLLLLLG